MGYAFSVNCEVEILTFIAREFAWDGAVQCKSPTNTLTSDCDLFIDPPLRDDLRFSKEPEQPLANVDPKT